ncbi:hypothetical protein ACFVYV_43455 [Streptomyces mirabilis]|uniref:hypothetical protein n=1 Tax=Streptomyces mirabilis TaxID=68239 RepID=UPI0036DA902E
MRSRLRWIRSRGQHVTVERNTTYTSEVFVKFLVLAFLLWMPVHILRWGDWIPFAGASLYLLWELGRINGALGELADLWNEQYRERQEAERAQHYQRRGQQRDQP